MATSNQITTGILRAVGIIAGIVIFLWFLYKIQSVVVYLVLAIIITLIGRPVVKFLKKRLKFGNTGAVITTMTLIFGVFLSLLLLFIPLIKQQSHNLSLMNIEALTENTKDLYVEALSYFSESKIDLESEIKDTHLLNNLDFSVIPEFINGFLGILGSFSIGLFSVIFISFFLLKDSKLLENSILSLVPDTRIQSVTQSITKIKDLLSRYFIGLIFQILILFVIYSAVLLIFGIENAIVIAFLCALLNIIPYVGPIIGGILMLFLSMSSNLGADFSTEILPTTLYVMIGFVIGQLIDNFFSQPLIYSNSVKSHPLEIFLVIIISGLLFGVVGMIAAIPAYTMIKVVAKQFLPNIKVVKELTKSI